MLSWRTGESDSANTGHPTVLQYSGAGALCLDEYPDGFDYSYLSMHAEGGAPVGWCWNPLSLPKAFELEAFRGTCLESYEVVYI